MAHAIVMRKLLLALLVLERRDARRDRARVHALLPMGGVQLRCGMLMASSASVCNVRMQSICHIVAPASEASFFTRSDAALLSPSAALFRFPG
eukprot:CAMPEP_0174763938 /NCGR_PEP_ID=MMETSP1094-20130205/110524_1 /TAXON_ID=156173 /ORGANISM="Chrysochromulina brevifilum, Strain UTEX LB 985" /LENGTH=92 /DNA_ID=CAMNT_0015969893 /DNA_START=1225 /DNA_END=1503 /DNA_ORIENTATION=-